MTIAWWTDAPPEHEAQHVTSCRPNLGNERSFCLVTSWSSSDTVKENSGFVLDHVDSRAIDEKRGAIINHRQIPISHNPLVSLIQGSEQLRVDICSIVSFHETANQLVYPSFGRRLTSSCSEILVLPVSRNHRRRSTENGTE